MFFIVCRKIYFEFDHNFSTDKLSLVGEQFGGAKSVPSHFPKQW